MGCSARRRREQTEGYRPEIQSQSDGVMPGHRETQQLAEQKRHRVMAGKARGREGEEAGAPWECVCPYHTGRLATVVLRLQECAQVLLALQ